MDMATTSKRRHGRQIQVRIGQIHMYPVIIFLPSFPSYIHTLLAFLRRHTNIHIHTFYLIPVLPTYLPPYGYLPIYLQPMAEIRWFHKPHEIILKKQDRQCQFFKTELFEGDQVDEVDVVGRVGQVDRVDIYRMDVTSYLSTYGV